MCLISFAYQCHPQYSLILLANRDEFYQRPTQPMHYWEDLPGILAGRDLEMGGTWLGVNRNGAFSAVTNFRDGRRGAVNRRSRGELTRNYLSSGLSATDYLDRIEAEQFSYGDFNLLLGDSNGLYYLSNRSKQSWQHLSPGVYGMSNALLDTPWPKLQQVKQELQAQLQYPEPAMEQLLNIMTNPRTAADADLPDTGISLEWERMLSSAFIHAENYGTRAITLLLQKPCGETRIVEHNFAGEGATERYEYRLQIPAIGTTSAV
ncbi:NRDE family protein [Neptuniibacter halophilus]|uniref:NRDE family protein n=1 Tax=Neptuniibacter halophilus TaxID=651666 RepID=UPI002572C07A|nr:NRDE family protein [Neptuniibacter halophilus]